MHFTPLNEKTPASIASILQTVEEKQLHSANENAYFTTNCNYVSLCLVLPCICSSNHVVSMFQSVKSIEERTRPNLCRTLKGGSLLLRSHTTASRLLMVTILLRVLVSLCGCRAGPLGRTGTGRGRRHHAPDGSLQAQFHRLNVLLLLFFLQHVRWPRVNWIPILALCHHRNTAIVAEARRTPCKNLLVGRIERYINLE